METYTLWAAAHSFHPRLVNTVEAEDDDRARGRFFSSERMEDTRRLVLDELLCVEFERLRGLAPKFGGILVFLCKGDEYSAESVIARGELSLQFQEKA